MTYSLVTVVHKPDYPMLRLQARSLAHYLSQDFAAQIYVIANQGLIGRHDWKAPLLNDYGWLADRVRFLEASEVATVPISPLLSGWHSQQILKLMIANVLDSDRYVVLDAKNHLVFPLCTGYFESGDKIRLLRMNYEGHAAQPYLENSLRYFGINNEGIVESCLPTHTPFVFSTQLVKSLIEIVERRQEMPFPNAFDSLGASEFCLFSAFVCSQPGGIARFYDLSGQWCPAIWPNRAVDADAVATTASQVDDKRLPFFTVHRDAFPLLDERGKEAIAQVWARRQLFESIDQARRFIAIFDVFERAIGFV